MPEPSSCSAAERGASAFCPETCDFLSRQWNQAGRLRHRVFWTPKASSTQQGSHSKPWRQQGCLHIPPWPWVADSRFSVDGIAWKSVRGLSLQDGGLESLLFFRDRCSWALVRGTSGTVLNICTSEYKKVTCFCGLGRKHRSES